MHKDVLIENNRLNEQLRTAIENQQFVQLISRFSTEVIALYDNKLNLLFLSPSSIYHNGYTPEEFKKINLSEFLHPEDYPTFIEQVLADNEQGIVTSNYIYRVKHKDGHYYWNESKAYRIMHDDGKLEYIIVNNKNVDNLVLARNQLSKINDTQAKIFSIIAHDLKAPFNNILGFSQLMRKKINDTGCTEKLKQYNEVILETAQHSYNLLLNLLDWSASQSNEIKFNPEETRLNKLVNETIQLMKNIALRKNIQINAMQDEAIIRADKNMIQTILRNLISNAIKYSYPDTVVEIKTELKKEYVHIAVKDTGLGIKEEELNVLFDSNIFLTTNGTDNEMGTGLGLALCKDFVDRHNGKIWAESVHTKGSEFHVVLPLR